MTMRRGEAAEDAPAQAGRDQAVKGRSSWHSRISSEPFLHPALFAALPAVSSMAGNIEILPPSLAIRPLLVEVVFAEFMAFALWRLLKHRELAALITTIFVVLFSSYGHVVLTLQFFLRGAPPSPHLYVAPLWVALFVFVVWASAKERERLRRFNGVLNAAAAVALVVPLIRIAVHEAQVNRPWGVAAPLPSLTRPKPEAGQPDIYYIILDGYGRQDVLEENLDLDNSEFVSFLRDRGFFVADEGRSNYAQTVLSLASSLNMEYLDGVQESMGEDSLNVKPLARLVRHSQVRRILESLGYKTVALTTGYRRTEIEDADLFIEAPQEGLSTLESLLTQTSALMPFYELAHAASLPVAYPGYLAHRSRVEFSLQELEQMPELDGPKFVFVHVVIPHPPFVFDKDGQPLPQDHFYELADASDYWGDPQEYIQGYSDQVVFLDPRIETIVSKLILDSPAPPIIIIQGDHGPGSHLDWSNPDDNALRERMAILNAYYFPGLDQTGLYDTMTPVNSFRVLFDEYFGADYDLLPDVSYFSSARRPYRFQFVPEDVIDGPAGG
jgi:hypothetical protein